MGSERALAAQSPGELPLVLGCPQATVGAIQPPRAWACLLVQQPMAPTGGNQFFLAKGAYLVPHRLALGVCRAISALDVACIWGIVGPSHTLVNLGSPQLLLPGTWDCPPGQCLGCSLMTELLVGLC